MNRPEEQGKFEHLLRSQKSNFDKAVFLRQLIADTIDAGLTSDSLCLNFASIEFDNFIPDSFFVRFADNSGAAQCGLAGSLLTKTLQNHNIEAYTYNYGFRGTRHTHVVVIAKTDSDAWTIHDPYFNYSITDSLGKPKDFFTLLAELSDNQVSNFRFVSDTVFRDHHFDVEKQAVPDFLTTNCLSYIQSEVIPSDTSNTVVLPICYECRLNRSNCPELDFFNKMAIQVEALGYPRHAVFWSTSSNKWCLGSESESLPAEDRFFLQEIPC